MTTKLGRTSSSPRSKKKARTKTKAQGTKLGRDLIEAMQEMIAIDRGESKPLRIDRPERTARRLTAEPAPEFYKARVVAVQKRLGVSQPVFARTLNVRTETVKAWEQGKNTPGGPAARLLEITEAYPEIIVKYVREKKL
jgi:DNA-binding transcriptional regulator YiaG